ncbi:MAG TPA: hypothetical protein VEP69_06025, partial [Thermodesulfovibrionales bacterium]|nr:hypothetical protein [Thermodesulfovibrionales bacterium]
FLEGFTGFFNSGIAGFLFAPEVSFPDPVFLTVADVFLAATGFFSCAFFAAFAVSAAVFAADFTDFVTGALTVFFGAAFFVFAPAFTAVFFVLFVAALIFICHPVHVLYQN